MRHKRHHYISEWRIARELSQTKLAQEVGVSPSNISQIESGHTGYTQASLEKIAVALRTTPAKLLAVDPLVDEYPEDFTAPFITQVISILKKMTPETRHLVHSLILTAENHEKLLHDEAMKREKKKNSGRKIILMRDRLKMYKSEEY